MSVKVLFGSLKGKSLPSLSPYLVSSVRGLRPTASMTRSVLFNLLRHNSSLLIPDFSSISVLDLCCGTGIVGIEFISLGVPLVSFIDSDYRVIRLLSSSHEYLGTTLNSRLSVQSIPVYIPQNTFDLIFFDPPYDDRGLFVKQMGMIYENLSLKSGGLVVLETDTSFKIYSVDGFDLVLERGVNSKTKLMFWKIRDTLS